MLAAPQMFTTDEFEDGVLDADGVYIPVYVPPSMDDGENVVAILILRSIVHIYQGIGGSFYRLDYEDPEILLAQILTDLFDERTVDENGEVGEILPYQCRRYIHEAFMYANGFYE